jgi:outer membrane protein assembly factor BamD
MKHRTHWGWAVVMAAGLAACGGGSSGVRPIATPLGIPRAAVESLYVEAVALQARGKWADAATKFERAALDVPAGDTLAIQARFRLAECQLGKGEQLQAAREFRKVSDETPNAALAPEALLRAGDAYTELWRRPELDPTYGQTAVATYQELLNRYPDSDAAPRARLRIKGLEEDFAVKQYKAAQYYLRLKAYDSAILYLKDIAATYPQAQITPAALLKLVDAYRRLDYHEDVVEVCGYIRRFHSSYPGIDQACPAPPDSTSGT